MAKSTLLGVKKPGIGFAPRDLGLNSDLELGSSGSSITIPASNQKSYQFTNVATELTRNSRYVVSKMAATPTVLSSVSKSGVQLTASTDENSSHAVLTIDENVYTWNYNSVDSIPTTIQLPGIPSNSAFSPLSLLVGPSAGSSKPGIVCINAESGGIRFYENVETISSIGLLQHHKGVESTIRLHDREIITMAENIEPAGILLATNQGRVILVCIRDFAGRPQIKTTDIIKRQTGFFSSVLEKSRQFVSIKAGAILGQGERIVALVSGTGDFQIWSCSSDGQAKRIFQNELLRSLTDSISELYPNAFDKLEVQDLALLSNFGDGDVFLLLTSFENGPNEVFYVLFTIKKEQDHLSIFSAYKLNTFTSRTLKRPKLYVPSPGSVAFIVFDTSVVLAELVTQLDHTLNLRRKWEDVVTFRSNVHIIGSGFEDLKKDESKDLIVQHPSTILIIPQIGVVKIEVLHNENKEEVPNTSVSSFLKSHIEQAVFYGVDDHNPIEFDLPEGINISRDEIEFDLVQVADEILLSKSAFLPPRLSSLSDHLKLRQQKLSKLLTFAITNFRHKVSPEVFLQLLSILQKISAAASLESVLSESSSNGEARSIFEEAVRGLKSSNLSDFLLTGLDDLNKVLSLFLKGLNNSNESQITVTKIITTIFSPVLELEKSFRYGILQMSSSQIGNEQLWFTRDEIYISINESFHKFSSLSQDNKTIASSAHIAVELAELLFYQTQQVLIWFRSQTPKTRAVQDSITSIESFYHDNSSFWTRTLVLFNAKNAALAIAETYKDLKSLAEISDQDRESASTEEEAETVQLRFSHYFNKFGYEFAYTLYNYLISVEKYQVLLLGFQEHSDYLRRFFEENDHSKISWIKDIFDDDFKKAAEVLLTSSQKNSESQKDKRLKLNIAKLSALASIEDIDNINSNDESLLNEIQEELDFSEAQFSILDQISQFIRSDNDPLAQVDLIVQDLLNNRYKNDNFSIIKKSFERALCRLLTNNALSVNELIDIFTLLDSSKTGNKLNFHYAFKVLHLSTLSEEEKMTNSRIIWTRCILSDNWSKITEDGKSGEYVKTLIETTNTFETLLNYFQDELFISNNDFNIPLPSARILRESDNDAQLLLRFKFIGGLEIDELRQELKAENESLSKLYQNAGLDQLIKGLIGTANEKSGANLVINYNELSIE